MCVKLYLNRHSINLKKFRKERDTTKYCLLLLIIEIKSNIIVTLFNLAMRSEYNIKFHIDV